MRGFGDFQRNQMKDKDPRVSEFFGYLRNAVDMLEQIVLRSLSSTVAERPSESQPDKPQQPIKAELPRLKGWPTASRS